MKNRKPYLRRRTKLIARLMAVLDTETTVSEAESVWLKQEVRFELVEITYQKEAAPMVLMLPGRIRLLWIYPPQISGDYDYCPDQRIMTHRLIGKPALGPSPPAALNFRRGEGHFASLCAGLARGENPNLLASTWILPTSDSRLPSFSELISMKLKN